MVETCHEGNTYETCELFNSCTDDIRVVSYQNADRKLYEINYIENSIDAGIVDLV